MKKIVDDVAALRPTLFIAVPRVLERIQSGIAGMIAGQGAVAKLLFGLAYKVKQVRPVDGPQRGGVEPSAPAAPTAFSNDACHTLSRSLVCLLPCANADYFSSRTRAQVDGECPLIFKPWPSAVQMHPQVYLIALQLRHMRGPGLKAHARILQLPGGAAAGQNRVERLHEGLRRAPALRGLRRRAAAATDGHHKLLRMAAWNRQTFLPALRCCTTHGADLQASRAPRNALVRVLVDTYSGCRHRVFRKHNQSTTP